jgi:protein involved in polysaccharide export with SLBB domain
MENKIFLAKIIFCLLFSFFVPIIFAQESVSGKGDLTASNVISSTYEAGRSVQIAISSSYYPITPGDVYTLSFIAGSVPVNYTIVIDRTYKVRVANLGIIDATEKSYIELKNQVEALVAKNYPMSAVQFVLTQTAQFTVFVTGEVKRSREAQAWALSRLSQFWDEHRTEYSSMRNVVIRSSSGIEKRYDLYRAWRYGDLSQDPYVRPGDTIIFEKYERQVTIEGEVKRPEKYQLVKGEGLKDLIEVYGNGITPIADLSRVELTRYVDAQYVSGEKIYLTEKDVQENYRLQDYDAVRVPQIVELKPVVFIEGAIGTGEVSTALEATNRISIQFDTGENYASLVRKYRNAFSMVSDTSNAYIIRQDQKIPINLNPMLYDASYKSEYFVEANDKLVIPFRQYFVTVSGAVLKPDRYPYIPDRDWSYYIELAGGFDPQKNRGERVTIFDISEKKMNKTDPIGPESIIRAENNSFLYYFNQYSPFITTTLFVVTTFLSIYTVTR